MNQHMKTKILTLAAIGTIFTSCGGPEKAEYNAAVEKICDCMREKTYENEKAAAESDFLLDIDLKGLDYSICIYQVSKEIEFDAFDEKMTESINEKCPELNSVHEEYIEDSK